MVNLVRVKESVFELNFYNNEHYEESQHALVLLECAHNNIDAKFHALTALN